MKRTIEIKSKSKSKKTAVDVQVDIKATVNMDGFARYESENIIASLTDLLSTALRNLPYNRGFYPHELKIKA